MDFTSGGIETSLKEYTPQALKDKKIAIRQMPCRTQL
jgi:hypothetical protein